MSTLLSLKELVQFAELFPPWMAEYIQNAPPPHDWSFVITAASNAGHPDIPEDHPLTPKLRAMREEYQAKHPEQYERVQKLHEQSVKMAEVKMAEWQEGRMFTGAAGTFIKISTRHGTYHLKSERIESVSLSHREGVKVTMESGQTHEFSPGDDGVGELMKLVSPPPEQ